MKATYIIKFVKEGESVYVGGGESGHYNIALTTLRKDEAYVFENYLCALECLHMLIPIYSVLGAKSFLIKEV